MIQACHARGLKGELDFDVPEDGHLRVDLRKTKSVESELFRAIVDRQVTRGEFDGKPISSAELTRFELAGTGKGVRILLFTEKQALENILEFVVQGNTAQMSDPAFMAELKS